MIILVDNEHETGYAKPWGEKIMAARVRIKYRLEDMAGEPCLIVRYDLVTPELFRDVGARAVFISGNSAAATDYEAEDQAGLRAAIAARAWPMFGFCGGFQVMAEAYGALLAPIGLLDPDDPSEGEEAAFAPGMRHETGYLPVHVTAAHPLLVGLSNPPVMRHAHAWEIKTVPSGFSNYASTEVTPIQMIVHDDLPIVGTQFHPEYSTAEYPDGGRLIENFMRWSGIVA
jgi:GMP synthase-like glutamine amidotransferase